MAITSTGRTVNQQLGAAFGAVYVLVGLLGFLVSSGAGFAGTEGGELLGIFEVNGLHNVVHLAVGALLLVAARTPGTARSVNVLVGSVYAVVGAIGLVIIGTEANLLALNAADNLLHFASAAVLLGVALSERRRTVAA